MLSTRPNTVALDNQTYNLIVKKAEKEGLTIKDYCNNILRWSTTKSSVMEKLFPKIEFVNTAKGHIILFDKKKDKIIGIRFKGDTLVCSEDEDLCDHISFCLGLPELGLIFQHDSK